MNIISLLGKLKGPFWMLELFAIVVGVFLAVIQLMLVVENSRHSHATDMVRAYYSKDSGYFGAQKYIDKWIIEAVTEEIDQQHGGKNFGDDQEFVDSAVHRQYKSLINNTRDNADVIAKLETSIFRVGNFLDAVSYCVIKGACDEQIISVSMRQDMKALLRSICPIYDTLTHDYNIDQFLAHTAKFLVSTKTSEEEMPCYKTVRNLANSVSPPQGFLNVFSAMLK